MSDLQNEVLRKYCRLFDATAVSMWSIDYSELKYGINEIVSQYGDIEKYLDTHREFLYEALNKIKPRNANEYTLKLYDAGTKEELFNSFSSIFLSESLETIRKIIIAIAEGKSYFEGEDIHRTIKGKPVHILISMKFPSDSKEFDSILVTIIDITRQKEAEKLLRERLSIESIVSAISNRFINISVSNIENELKWALTKISEYFSADCSFVNLYSNDFSIIEEVYLWCHKEPEIRLRQFKDLSLEPFSWTMNKLNNNECFQISDINKIPPEAFNERELCEAIGIKSFLFIPMLVNKKLIGAIALTSEKTVKTWAEEDIKVLQIIGEIFVNILERKKNNDKLKESAELYRTLVNFFPDGILVHWKDKIVFANEEAIKMIGAKSLEQIVGMELENIFHSDYKEILSKRLKNLEKNQSVPLFECKFLRLDGIIIEVEIKSVRCIYNGENAILSIIRDITDIKVAEKEKKNLESQIRQRQKIEAIGTLAGGIAHDFNNILGAIMGFTELALDDVSEGSLTRDNLNQVLLAGRRAKELIKQILTFSQKGEQEKKPVEIKSIVSETLKMLKATLPSTIDIVEKLQEESSVILADPTQIHQVILNLCTNSSYAMSENGGTLELEVRNINSPSNSMTDYIHSPGEYVVLSVKDTGKGMDRDTLDRIFEPFFSTKKIGEGHGLGLSVVDGIIKSHGGDIKVYSELNKGTKFYIFLPRIKTDPGSNSDDEDTIIGGTESILFVDDEKSLVNLIKQILEKLGYTFYGTTSSFDALKIFRETPEKFDLVITDHTMPGMTGTELSHKLFEIKPEIPVILCSGYNDTTTLEKVKNMGIRDFIVKPITTKSISSAIRRIFD